MRNISIQTWRFVYLKAYAEPEHDIELAEYTINDPTMNIVTDLFTKKPDVIGFSCYIWNIEETIKVIQNLRKILPDVKIVLGGPEVSYDFTYWLKTDCPKLIISSLVKVKKRSNSF